jgi:hypothetical protein
MLIAEYSGVFTTATFKFLFAPLVGWQVGLSFLEIFIVTALGGWLSFTIFYFSASFFMQRAFEARIKKEAMALEAGTHIPRRKFTRFNKLIIRIKRMKYGYPGVVFLAPAFLSVPVGSIVVAKFYGGQKQTYWFTLLALTVWALINTLFWMITA